MSEPVVDDVKVCDEVFGCGEPTSSTFSFTKKDWNHPDSDEEGYRTVRVCRDCASRMEDDE